ncbi:ABC transporter protein [Halomicronema hongdechloris C2206]|uniref:ABC transporter protein n=1 Tax=Halomicronema hongdechloris C2206 TaxID=1641165 RepID=A0A1Z3HH35_9CYAN|nr:ABC transporter ATP-binding protein [Halomicronema hongdechloris]ASC69517.1 ABC transporter protein [Halomicronema hongdechloris C2206]
MNAASFSSSPADAPARPVVVQTHELSKVYRAGFWLNQAITSLRRCSLTVYQGETFGLLGPNGAGKTTLLKILLGMVRPTSGRVLLLDHSVDDRRTKQRIGYLPENPYFYDFLTGWEFLQYTAGVFGLSSSLQRQRIPALLDLVGLARSTVKKKPLRQYSKGMLQRIGIAQALINDPEVVFLDEPMSGLDPMGRYQVREIILSLQDQGKTIFFNSHILSDVEMICDRIAILDGGELVCVGGVNELLGIANQYFVKGRGGTLDVLEQWLEDLDFQGGYWRGYLKGEPYDFMASLQLMNGKIATLQLARPSLEEFFVQRIRQRRNQQGDHR